MKSDNLKSDEITGEKRLRVESEDIPLYRSYGVTKKVNPTFRAIRDFLFKILIGLLFAVELFLMSIGIYMMAKYTGVLIATLLAIVVTAILLVNITKLPRRRLSFLRKLKKICKENGYELEQRRKLFRSLKWTVGKEVDFKLKAGGWTYYVKYATSKRFLASFTFLSKNEMKYTKIARESRIATIFDFKDRSITVPIAFPDEIDDNDKYSVKAILINPAVMDVNRKGSDGSTIPTGSGEKLFGYTIFTATGFIETLKRNSESENNEK